jgi:serine/threonine protein kinase
MPEDFYKQPTLPGEDDGKTPAIPAQIGPYKIDSLLSKGGMSLLYLGVDSETRKILAIKVLSPAFVTHPELISRFLTEAKIIGMTSHPNIVKLYNQGEWEGGLFIAMEFIQGISLRQFIQQHSLSLKRSLEIVLQVAYALCHLHTHGVVHRDLKPENILITEDGEIKVIDFGIAGLHEEPQERTVGGGFMGTPSYMSPEQKENPQNASFGSDIYSLGVITYELILGRLSYGVINLSFIPRGLKRVVEKALAVSTSERYQDVVDFIADIAAYLQSDEIEKERSGSDLLKEWLEILGRAGATLSPAAAPKWPQLEIGIAKHRGPQPPTLYYDFFRLPDDSYIILIASSLSTELSSSLYIAVLRGMIQTLIHEIQPSGLDSTKFIERLGGLCAADPIHKQFSLSFLHLNTRVDLFTFVSCGDGFLLHIPSGEVKPRKLISLTPLLGSPLTTGVQVASDNWNTGDLLILHSLAIPAQATTPEQHNLETHFLETVQEQVLLSPQRQAESILKKMLASPFSPLQKTQQVLLSIQRLL